MHDLDLEKIIKIVDNMTNDCCCCCDVLRIRYKKKNWKKINGMWLQTKKERDHGEKKNKHVFIRKRKINYTQGAEKNRLWHGHHCHL